MAVTRTLVIAVLAAPLALALPAAAQADRDCGDFRFREDAQAFFEAAGPGDPHRLDADDDGLACETLPRRGATAGTTAGAADGPRVPRTPRPPRLPGEIVADPLPAGPTARPSTDRLPTTGRQTVVAGTLGTAMLLVGLALVASSRRRMEPAADPDDHTPRWGDDPLIGW